MQFICTRCMLGNYRFIRWTVLAMSLLTALAPCTVHSQQTPSAVDRTTAPPVANATRVERRAPNVDGRLDDEVWRRAAVISDFTQVRPVDGTEPTQRTEVRVVYDEDALYVSARLYDSEPSAISSRLGRRDANTSSDLFTVMIDSYHDHRTAFRFTVNPAGVRRDNITTDDTNEGDSSWNPVWEVSTAIDSLGWTAEIRIPFSQLRFSSAAAQVWGINFARFTFRSDELVRWSWAPNTEERFASLFGHLYGVRDIAAPRRIEVLPYTVAKSDFTEGADPGNPFNDGGVQSVSAGLDLKYGLTSDLTLDATVDPDFGQVEADPAVMNLTAFESFFTEQRPFFVEGANIFRFGAGNGGPVFNAPFLFYSRRIGNSPSRTVHEDGGYVDNPTATRILGAAKVSGKSGGWSIGVLDALTARTSARIERIDGNRTSEPVEPLTNYGVLGLRRDMRGGASGIGIMATTVHRDLDDPLFDYLRSSAYSGGFDFFHRLGNNQFMVKGAISASHVRGNPRAILLTQRSSARYYQRPDQDHVSVDSNATSLTGWAAAGQIDKVSGRWVYGTGIFAWSPGLELNDAGFRTFVDRIGHVFHVGRRWLDPGRLFRRLTITGDWQQHWNFGGAKCSDRAGVTMSSQFLNYWTFNIGGQLDVGRILSHYETRGGPLTLRPATRQFWFVLGTDPRNPVTVRADAHLTKMSDGGWRANGGIGLDVRPTTWINLEVLPRFTKSRTAAFYITQLNDPLATSTYGSRYVFGELEENNLDTTLRMDVALSPDLSVQLYAQPFLASGDYEDFKELAAPSTRDFLHYGVDGSSALSFDNAENTYTVDPDGSGPAEAFSFRNPDFRYRSLRGNLVVRWECLPGSTLFLVWNHNQSGRDTDPTFNIFDEFGSMVGDDQRNTFIVKASYWLSR